MTTEEVSSRVSVLLRTFQVKGAVFGQNSEKPDL